MTVKETYNYYSGNIPITITIEFSETDFVLLYNMSIASISKNTELLLDKIRNEVINKVGVKLDDATDPKRSDYFQTKFKETIGYLLAKYIPDLNDKTKDFLMTYLAQKSLGLGKIELLLDDNTLEEIVVNNALEAVWVYHHRYGWLKTNIFLENEEQIKHYAALIGRKVGRSITLLTPLLDARLETGERVNATLNPISIKGNTLTLRKFNVKPITITTMLQEKTISLPASALIWAGMEYELSALVAGGTATGKTVLLSALCGFFPPNQRIISVEDSVTRDCEILYQENKIIKKSTMGDLIDGYIKNSCIKLRDGTELTRAHNIKIFSMNKEGKVELKKPSALIRHKVNKKIFEIKLSSGRKIKVTEDHSLFSLIRNEIREIKCSALKIGSFIATPRILPCTGSKKIIDLTLNLNNFENFMIKGEPIKRLILKYGKDFIKNKSNRQHYRNNSILPVRIFKNILNKVSAKDKKLLRIVPKRSSNLNGRRPIPVIVKIDNNLARIIGMWLADGCYDKNSIIISDPNNEVWNVIKDFGKKYSLPIKLHSDKVSAMINSKCWKRFFEDVLELKGNAYTKKVPAWVFDLDNKTISYLLSGYFSGDGYAGKYEISAGSSSSQLLKDVQTLLLRFGIPLRINWSIKSDKTYNARISGVKFIKVFKEEINFIQNYKKDSLNLMCKRGIHDVTDIIPLEKHSYLPLKHMMGDDFKFRIPYTSWKTWHMAYKNRSDIGREKLKYLMNSVKIEDISLMERNEFRKLIKLVNNDIFWEKIVDIKEIIYNDYVYDLSVPGNESFICNNIIAHNTQELILPKNLHWVPMITREPNVEGKGEITMLDLIINSLRMRPDRIVVGEIRRQREAETLFEAMHTGHSVYATLHANDTEETLNRLLNPPINVPKSSLPAISMIIIMYRNRRTGIRRVFQLSEVNKDSSAKVLMQYDLRSDKMSTISKSIRLMPELQLQTGFTEQEIDQDLKEKSLILSWLVKKNIDTVDEIGKVIATYYSDRERLLRGIKI